MSGLPLGDARQLQRLRALRVQRARSAVQAAQATVQSAQQQLERRAAAVQQLRDAAAALARDTVHGLAGQLPRWSEQVHARREELVDLLEREAYALIDDRHELERAQEKLQEARAEVTRALAREDTVRGLVDDARRALRLAAEAKAEVELEDAGRPQRAAA